MNITLHWLILLRERIAVIIKTENRRHSAPNMMPQCTVRVSQRAPLALQHPVERVQDSLAPVVFVCIAGCDHVGFACRGHLHFTLRKRQDHVSRAPNEPRIRKPPAGTISARTNAKMVVKPPTIVHLYMSSPKVLENRTSGVHQPSHSCVLIMRERVWGT